MRSTRRSTSNAVRVAADGVLVATGHENFDPVVKPRLGYRRLPGVMTGFEAEQALVGRLDLGGQSVAFIQCVGSRDPSLSRNFCSAVCCAYALRMARVLKHRNPQADVTVYYIDIQHFDKVQSAFRADVERAGVKLVRGIPSSVSPSARAAGPGHRRSRHLGDHRGARHRGALGGHGVGRRRPGGGSPVRPGTRRLRVLHRAGGQDQGCRHLRRAAGPFRGHVVRAGRRPSISRRGGSPMTGVFACVCGKAFADEERGRRTEGVDGSRARGGREGPLLRRGSGRDRREGPRARHRPDRARGLPRDRARGTGLFHRFGGRYPGPARCVPSIE